MRKKSVPSRSGQDQVHWSMSCGDSAAGGEGSLAATIPTVEEIAALKTRRGPPG
jgi:hypothetical protein